MVVTIDGRPAAELGPLTQGERTLEDLIAAGLVIRPRSNRPPDDVQPVKLPPGPSMQEILDELRSE